MKINVSELPTFSQPVVVRIDAQLSMETMTVTPPPGFIAWPESVTVEENGAGVVFTMNEGMM